MIEMLADRLNAAVDILVTQGEHWTLRMSASGYYREAPEAWGATQLRHLNCWVQAGQFEGQLHAEEYVEDGWPVVIGRSGAVVAW